MSLAMLKKAEIDEWSDLACSICNDPKRERTFSEVVALVRGLRWAKDLEEVQDAITVLSKSRVVQGGSVVDQERVVKVITRLCEFTDPDAR